MTIHDLVRVNFPGNIHHNDLGRLVAWKLTEKGPIWSVRLDRGGLILEYSEKNLTKET